MASDWLIGSYPDLPAQTVTVTVPSGSNSEVIVVTAAADDLYMIHTTAALSYAAQLETALNTHGSLGGDTFNVEIMESGKMRVWTTSGTTFGITWTTTEGRDLGGWTGNLSAANSYVASKSAYWWSSNRKASPTMSPLGIVGQIVSDAVVGSAGDSTTRVTENNTYRVNDYFWRYVPLARVWTSSEAGGEWYAFHDAVIRKGRQFYLWPDIAEDSTDDATTVTLTSGLGPYKGTQIGWDYNREITNVDKLTRIDLSVIQVAEFS